MNRAQEKHVARYKGTTGRKRHLTVMRNAFILLLAGNLNLSAGNTAPYCQTARLSVEATGMTVSDVLRAIEEQSQFYFTYNSGQINTRRTVSINIKDRPVNEVLDELFRGENVGYTINDRHIVLYKSDSPAAPAPAQADEKRITGTIVDNAGVPIIGANVSVKGTTTGTITDVDGNFSLSVPADAVVEISYIGYLTETFKVGNRSHLEVVLLDRQGRGRGYRPLGSRLVRLAAGGPCGRCAGEHAERRIGQHAPVQDPGYEYHLLQLAAAVRDRWHAHQRWRERRRGRPERFG